MIIDYNALAADYMRYRAPDERIAAAVNIHLTPDSKVLNVGAGQGAYEPADCDLVALERSWEMISRRSAEKAIAVQGCAENLPFADDSFDTTLAILTLHHWSDIQKGLSEIKRVTRGKLIILTWNGEFGEFWLPDYLPQISQLDKAIFPSIDHLSDCLNGNIQVETIEIPHDCSDGFMCAYWRRPEFYLDAGARNAISTFSRLSNMDDGLNRLKRDIHSGAWRER